MRRRCRPSSSRPMPPRSNATPGPPAPTAEGRCSAAR
jgi:hypothetical protein